MADIPICEIRNGNLFLDNSKIDLPRKVEQALVVDDKVIYRFVVDGKNVSNRNVGALDFNGNTEWVIQEVNSKLDFKEYTKIRIENGELIASNWTGMSYKVSVESGNITPYKFFK